MTAEFKELEQRDCSKLKELKEEIGDKAFIKLLANWEQNRCLAYNISMYAPEYVSCNDEIDVFSIIHDLELV